MRTLSVLLVSAAILFCARDVQAQGLRAAGGFAGWVEGRQVIGRQGASGTRSGLMVGAFVDVATNASWLDVMAEAYFVQRGGSVPLDSLTSEVQVDYLAFAVLPKVRFGLGPLSFFAYAGPNFDYHLRTRAGGELEDVYRQFSPVVFGVALAGGVEMNVGQRGSLRLELRHDEQLSGAFPEAPTDVHHRSNAIVLRYGRRGTG